MSEPEPSVEEPRPVSMNAEPAALDGSPDRIADAQSATGVVAVLSHHATFAMQMRRAGFDVLERRDIDDLAKLGAPVDVVVVDLVAVDGKRGVVARLSTSVDPRVPIVLISADEIDLALLGSSRQVHVVVPPVRADDVVARVRDILAARVRQASADSDGRDPARPEGSVTPLRGRKRPRAGHDSGQNGHRPPAEPTAATPAPGSVSRADTLTVEARPPKVKAVSTTRTVPPAPGGASSSAVVDLAALPLPVLDWRIVADQLTRAVQAIPAVPVIAQAMAEELAATSGAHVAVMARDDSGSWRVEAGVGLRSFEWAQTLEDDHWLVWAGRDQHPSLMVMDTDVVRGDLAGAPLASRYQLVRTHSTRAAFFVCAGWEVDGGNETDRVSLVVQAVRRHGPAMSDALGVRSFAQWISTHVGGVDAVLRS